MLRMVMLALALVLPVLVGAPASAHILKVFAEVQGDTIVGEGYFSNGAVPAQHAVDIFGPDKQKVGEVITDDKGKFSFKPIKRQNYTFVIDAGEGHRAEWVIEGDELPATLSAK
jgi:nickel transport protein